MQKLLKRNYIHTLGYFTSPKLYDSELNKVERLSVQGLKTFNNNPEVNLPQHTGGSIKPLVYVLNQQSDNPLLVKLNNYKGKATSHPKFKKIGLSCCQFGI